MRIEREEAAGWDRRAPAEGATTLLLDELQHRVANEIAASLAALHLARPASLSGRRAELYETAVRRLEGFGQVNRMLAGRGAKAVDLGKDLRALCVGLFAGRAGMERVEVDMASEVGIVSGDIAHRVMLIATELVFNAMRHALMDRAGRLGVRLRDHGDHLTLEVADDGPGILARGPSSGTGLGSGIVEALVSMGGGRMECESDRDGTSIRVTLPYACPPPRDFFQDPFA